jgi:hypothetical protein
MRRSSAYARDGSIQVSSTGVVVGRYERRRHALGRQQHLIKCALSVGQPAQGERLTSGASTMIL